MSIQPLKITASISEENLGGVDAVLAFLASGDIAAISEGRIGDLQHLYSEAGVADALA